MSQFQGQVVMALVLMHTVFILGVLMVLWYRGVLGWWFYGEMGEDRAMRGQRKSLGGGAK